MIALDLDGKGDHEFNDVKLNKLDLDGVEIIVFKEVVSSMASLASPMDPSPARVGGIRMSMALMFLMAVVSLKASPAREARAGGL